MSIATLRPWRAIAVYCGSSVGNSPVYAEAARTLGQVLAARGLGLVYGGGSIGLMGVVAQAVLDGGGTVHGVITEALHRKEVGNANITTLEVVETMHARKARMADLADGSIILPGGYGTLDEFMETVTWNQLGVHAKPCGVLNVANFYDPLFEFIDHAVDHGFIPARYADSLLVNDDPTALLDAMRTLTLPTGITVMSGRDR